MKQLLEAIAKLADMKEPSVYRILNSRGFKHEADAIADLIDAYNALLKEPDVDLQQEHVALTFEEHTDACARLIAKRPEVAAFKAIYCTSNDYSPFEEMVWLPTVGHLDEKQAYSCESLDEEQIPGPLNAVCIN